MTMKKAGFFRELRHGDRDGPSLEESKNNVDEPKTVEYLKSGAVIATTGRRVGDVLDPEHTDVADLAVLTDGEWVWPADLAYYVDRYGVALPAEFVSHMRALDWRPPELTDDELAALVVEMPKIG
jgi:hypothetical protein